MIILYHHNDTVTGILDADTKEEVSFTAVQAADALKSLSERYPKRWVVWCDDHLKKQLDLEQIKKHLTHTRMMLSHNVGDRQYLGSALGYVEESPFVNVTKDVAYPTWQMSSVGAIYGETLANLMDDKQPKADLLFLLTSVAKMGQGIGLVCKQVPLTDDRLVVSKASNLRLFRFAAMHYKKRWLPFLLFCVARYDRKFPVWSFLNSLFTNKWGAAKELPSVPVSPIDLETLKIDVLIPTIGRKKFLYDVLKDLKSQTLLPQKVIIIEQNPEPNSSSQLDYLALEHWPFEIKHIFIHQTGACNARNLGLKEVTGDWVFLADDDIRFGEDVIAKGIAFAKAYDIQALTLSCLQKNEVEKRTQPIQWNGFGSGCSFVSAAALEGVLFDPALEHGFGEDADFGNQLRKKGVDILYHPNIRLQHLKAPVGGFRAPMVHPWEAELPKPSPTVMISILKHWSLEQRQSYKLTLWGKFYRLQSVKNPYGYLKMMRKRWDASLKWAHKLQDKKQ